MKFFIGCQIGAEKILENELKSFWFEMLDLDGLPTRKGYEIINLIPGGIEIETEMHLGLQINFFSKIANRVLMRQFSFDARYFDQFEKELSKINFGSLFESDLINFEIDSSKSRLFHEKNLSEVILKIFKIQKLNYNQNCFNKIYFRLFKDKVTISLDTSGEHLHKRGYRRQQGVAPIRETLASILLQRGDVSSKSNIFLDPFMGSGTLLYELAFSHKPNFEREFAFFKFKKCPGLFKSESWRKNYFWLNDIKIDSEKYFYGCEIDSETFIKAEKIRDCFTDSRQSFTFYNKNSQQLTQDDFQNQPLWIVTNPPYGERLSADSALSVLHQLADKLNVVGVTLVHPSDWEFKFKNLTRTIYDDFNNQGLNLKLSQYELKSRSHPK